MIWIEHKSNCSCTSPQTFQLCEPVNSLVLLWFGLEFIPCVTNRVQIIIRVMWWVQLLQNPGTWNSFICYFVVGIKIAAVWPWGKFLIFLSFSFLIYDMEWYLPLAFMRTRDSICKSLKHGDQANTPSMHGTFRGTLLLSLPTLAVPTVLWTLSGPQRYFYNFWFEKYHNIFISLLFIINNNKCSLKKMRTYRKGKK